MCFCANNSQQLKGVVRETSRIGQGKEEGLGDTIFPPFPPKDGAGAAFHSQDLSLQAPKPLQSLVPHASVWQCSPPPHTPAPHGSSAITQPEAWPPGTVAPGASFAEPWIRKETTLTVTKLSSSNQEARKHLPRPLVSKRG